jgi:hypothetical protein
MTVSMKYPNVLVAVDDKNSESIEMCLKGGYATVLRHLNRIQRDPTTLSNTTVPSKKLENLIERFIYYPLLRVICFQWR